MEAKTETVKDRDDLLDLIVLSTHARGNAADTYQSIHEGIVNLVAQTRASALEEAEKAVENEHLIDPSVEPDDQAYDNAIKHAVAAIQALRSKDA